MANSLSRPRGSAFVAACLLGIGLAIAAPGDLDPDFGDGGLVSLKFSDFGHSATAVAQQADGRLLIVGLGDVVLSNDDDFIVARLGADGTLDAGFGVSGAAVADYAGFFDVPYAAVQQPDGKIVLAGAVGVSATASDMGVARFNSDGTLDATFGNGGWAAIDLGGDDEAAYGLIRQPGGRLIAAGYTNAGGTNQAAFVRVTGAGALDATFGTAGTTLLDFGAGSQSHAYDLAPQSSGKLVSVGRVVSPAGESGIALARLSADGIPDPSFDSDGLLTLPIEGDFEDAFSVVIQPDDYIVTAGYESAQGAGHYNAVVRRLDADGVPDAAFGSGGKATLDFGSESIFYELVAQPDGDIVATGYRLTGEFVPDLILSRLDAAGQLDTGFGIDGVAVADFGAGEVPPYGVGYGLVRQFDGKYVAVGTNFNTGSMIVARFDDGASAAGRVGLTNTFRSDAETAPSISYTVRRTGGHTGAVSVSYATTAGTAQPGADFESISGTLSWNDGEADEKTLTIDLIDDSDAEPPETFTLSLTNPTGGALLAASEATAQIVSSDGPGQLGFSYRPFDFPCAGTEGEGDVVLTAPVFRLNGSEGAISVSYSVESGTATEGEDFVMSGMLSWADGETAIKGIRIEYLEDTLAEGRETFRIELRNPAGGATLNPSARFWDCIINDNEPPPSILGLAKTRAQISEGGSIDLSVVRSGPSAGAVSVDYATSSGSATAGSDFTSASGTLTWADGDAASRTFTIDTLNDATDESVESFTVALSNPSTGAALGSNSTLTVTITDNDSPVGTEGGGGSNDRLLLLGLLLLGLARSRGTNTARPRMTRLVFKRNSAQPIER